MRVFYSHPLGVQNECDACVSLIGSGGKLMPPPPPVCARKAYVMAEMSSTWEFHIPSRPLFKAHLMSASSGSGVSTITDMGQPVTPLVNAPKYAICGNKGTLVLLPIEAASTG